MKAKNTGIENKQYDNEKFYQSLSGSMKSAKEVLSLLFEVFKPASILDVGCGLGDWLAAAKELGVSDITGIDGNYLNPKHLKIDRSNFKDYDLKQPFDLNRHFDLVMCLEVGEHLPEDRAESFIENITRHGDIILFSAAIPGQTGTYHINEQWQSYWKKKFETLGYDAVDIIRPGIWNNKNVEFWYKQNCFLYIKKTKEINSRMDELKKKYFLYPTDIVHPELLNMRVSELEFWQNSLRTIPAHLLNFTKKYLKSSNK